MTLSHTPSCALALATGLAAVLAGCPAPAGLGPQPGASGAAAAGPGQPGGLVAGKTIPVGKTPHGLGAAGGFVYNSDVGDARLSVIDAKTDAVVTTIPFADGAPGYVKAFHDGKQVLVTDTKKGELLVIDPAKAHAVVQRIALGKGPDKLRIDEDDKTVLASLTGEPKAILLTFGADRSQPPARQELAVGPAIGDHRDAALAGGWAVVANQGDNNVSLLNLGTGASQAVTGGNNPGPVGVGVTGETAVAAIVGNAASNTVSLFELPGFTATTLADVGLTPTDMVVDEQLGRAFISMAGSNELAVVDYVAKKLVGKVATGKRPVHVYMAPVLEAPAKFGVLDHDHEALSHEIWVGNDDGASVTIVDGETLRVKATVGTGEGHHKMAFANGKGYVSNIKANDVAVIDRATIK